MNKIDFAIIITAVNCNPNGDPLNNNMPRHDYDGYGEISDVCIKRKIRDRLQEMGENILIVNREKATDGLYSVKSRLEACPEFNSVKDDPVKSKNVACAEWFDVRAFGQVLSLKKTSGIASTNVRGPVSIGIAKSLEPVEVYNLQITKSLNNDEDAYERDTTTMGMHYIVRKGIYVSYGSIFPQLANLTGFTDDDAEKIKLAMIHLFDNDASAFRPSGSMNSALIWAQHNSIHGSAPAIKVHRSFGIKQIDEYPYYEYNVEPISGVNVNIYE